MKVVALLTEGSIPPSISDNEETMNLGIIGTGRMAQAITGGLLKTDGWPAEAIGGYDPNPESREAFLDLDAQKRLRSMNSLADLVQFSQVLLIAVKPQNIEELFARHFSFDSIRCVVSIAAGISLKRLEQGIGSDVPVVRVMPNTPMLIGRGVAAWCGNRFTTEDHEKILERLFSGVAEVYQVNESEMDAITALSGSGPAFFYRILQAFASAAIEEGLEAKRARTFACKTAEGAAALLQSSHLEPDDLVAQVRSKGGTTEAGLRILESSALADILKETISAAARRSRELGQNPPDP